MKIGLIGLGIMGKPMAKNLLKAGYTDLLVSDLNQAAVDEVVAAGATAATQPEIGASCDVVLTMLPNSPQVKQVMLGEDGVAAHMRPGTHLYRHELHQPGGQQGDRRRIGGKEHRHAGRPRFRRRAQGHRRHPVLHGGGQAGGL